MEREPIKKTVFIFQNAEGRDLRGSVLPDGQPVLGCARPSCFGWTAEGERAADTAWFYRINKKQDGFLRKSDIGRLQKIRSGGTYVPQTSDCDEAYRSSSCDGDDQWVGGIGPSTNASKEPLSLRCCKYDKLIEAQERSVVDVSLGQTVMGGEVTKNGRQYAFDYIANIKKFFGSSDRVSYVVIIRRFPCLPPFTEGKSKEFDRLKFFLQNRPQRVDDTARLFHRRSLNGLTITPKRKVKVVYEDTPEYEKVIRKLKQQIMKEANDAQASAIIHRNRGSVRRFSSAMQRSSGTKIGLVSGPRDQRPIANTRNTFVDLQPQNINKQNVASFQSVASSWPRPGQLQSQMQPPQQLPQVVGMNSQSQPLFRPVQQIAPLPFLPTFMQPQSLMTTAPSLSALFPQPTQQPILFGLPQQQQHTFWPLLQQPHLPAPLQAFQTNRVRNSRSVSSLAVMP
ncbi:unnamed protein product [Toxocara canis]|uniref:YDG domain-containing protein n=1 Tax=Toxocara canis TaxID=6265 RepID=A0A183TV73_TOXCA|nr:unnamed protein product [Toxocara canis]